MASERTTQFTRVEISDLSHHGDNLGANFHVTGDGQIDSDGTLDNRDGIFLSRVTSASATSVVLADGEFAITESSVTSIVLAFRSGATTYQVVADSASVL